MTEEESRQWTARVDRACSLRSSGRLLAALDLLLPIPDGLHGSELDRAYLIIGGVYFLMSDWEHAADCFRKATLGSPELELASRSLCVSLIQLGKPIEAIEEMQRFIRFNFSEGYKELYQQIRDAVDENSDLQNDLRERGK